MTDKINPGWISDRLPTEEDGDEQNTVLFINEKGTILSVYIPKIIKGDWWCGYPEEELQMGAYWNDFIATPQECIDREKEILKQEIAERDAIDDECYDKPLKNHPANIQEKKFKDLEKALAKSEERVRALELENKELSKAWKTLLEHNDQEDLLSDKLEAENKKLIIDLELFRKGEKGYEKEGDYYKNLFELEVDERKVIEGYLEDEHNQNDILRKLLKSLL